MTKEKLIKELELLADSCDSNYALETNGYNRGVLDALDVVNKYFSLAHVIKSVCEKCRFKAECRYKEMNIEQNCKYFIDEQTVL